MIPTFPVSTLIPEPHRSALIASSKIESRIEAGECEARTAAVDAAASAARAANPSSFKE